MHFFGYGVEAAERTENVLITRGLALISDIAWVKGTLYDTGLGFPALAPGEESVYGKLYDVEEETLHTINALANRFNEINPPYRFVLHHVPVSTPKGDFEALTFRYESGKGLEKILSGVWK
jgi:gamma-glutamylcyclotransferase (GGCT)/AIG2-like uncharacterized protein YtfP